MEQGSKGMTHTLYTKSNQGENKTLDIKFNVSDHIENKK